MPEPSRVIAIDGPAASGKTTLGKALANALGYRFLDTGEMYRAVARNALQRAIPADDEAALARMADSLNFQLVSERLWVDGVPAGDELHVAEVDASVSEVSAHATVREMLVRVQREIAKHGPIVMVGRDIGTTVFPDAEVKMWITASDEERARRRRQERPTETGSENEAAELARLGSRDAYDSTRATSPLRQAPDAILINTDHQSPGQVLDQALAVVRGASGDGLSYDKETTVLKEA